jgi:geranylgeranyl diphosphate synthase type II
MELKSWISKTDFSTEEKVNAVRNIYNKVGIKDLSENLMQSYAQQALDNLDKINASKESKSILLDFADMLVNREH